MALLFLHYFQNFLIQMANFQKKSTQTGFFKNRPVFNRIFNPYYPIAFERTPQKNGGRFLMVVILYIYIRITQYQLFNVIYLTHMIFILNFIFTVVFYDEMNKTRLHLRMF
jgi:hypothetical protein